jgi:hypothetical protein
MRARKSVRIGAVAALSSLLFAAVAAAEGRIEQREENQQRRIAQGVRSGQLTPRETARLERRESRLNGEVHHLRKDDGGKLTSRERRIVNRQQNRLSRHIDRQKHDARHRG